MYLDDWKIWYVSLCFNKRWSFIKHKISKFFSIISTNIVENRLTYNDVFYSTWDHIFNDFDFRRDCSFAYVYTFSHSWSYFDWIEETLFNTEFLKTNHYVSLHITNAMRRKKHRCQSKKKQTRALRVQCKIFLYIRSFRKTFFLSKSLLYEKEMFFVFNYCWRWVEYYLILSLELDSYSNWFLS